jgi:hypothetical protein
LLRTTPSIGRRNVSTAADGPTRRTIETGYRGTAYTEIVRGLDAGDVVILGTERP